MIEKSRSADWSGVFRFPSTPDGRQLLRDMLPGIRNGSVPDDFDFEAVDFDDLAADLKLGEDAYEQWLREQEGGGE